MYAVYNTDNLRKDCACMFCWTLTIREVTACVCQATANRLVSLDCLYRLHCACYAIPSIAVNLCCVVPCHAVLCMLCKGLTE